MNWNGMRDVRDVRNVRDVQEMNLAELRRELKIIKAYIRDLLGDKQRRRWQLEREIRRRVRACRGGAKAAGRG